MLICGYPLKIRFDTKNQQAEMRKLDTVIIDKFSINYKNIDNVLLDYESLLIYNELKLLEILKSKNESLMIPFIKIMFLWNRILF